MNRMGAALRRWMTCGLSLVAISSVQVRAEEPSREKLEFFEKKIRPALVQHCYECHSAEAVKTNKLRGGLLLDSRPGWEKGGDSGPAITAGDADSSLLVSAIKHEGLEMPPKGKLPDETIADFVTWINMGAPDPRREAPAIDVALREKAQQHWAYRAVVKPMVPSVQNAAWARNEVDRFVLARLEKEQLSPSTEADRVTLLRRLSLDLIGLPATIEEVDAFLNDTSTDAYEKQVERLLRSPHYGERWGRHWLDAARYADSDGYEKDKPRSVWMYRDWVVSALNRDLPYDQFVIEQIAGDMLPNPSQDQLVATGFLRNSMINEEGGVDPEQFRMDAMFDRMDAIGKSILGLAISCSQCHDHKYDPITQEDYYRLFAFINDTHEANIPVYAPEELRVRANVLQEIQKIEEELQHHHPDWPEKLAAWEETVRGSQGDWVVVKSENAGDNSQRYIYHEDGSQMAWGYAPTKWTSQFRGETDCTNITGFRIEMLTDPNLPLGGPGRSPLGLFALTEFNVEAQDRQDPTKTVNVKFVAASADYGNEEKELEPMFDDKSGKKRMTGPVNFAIDGKDDTAWGIDAGPGRRNVDRNAVFVPEKPVQFQTGAKLTFSVKQMHGGWNSDDNQNNNLGRFRFSVTSGDEPKADPIPKKVREILVIPREQRRPDQIREVFRYWRTTVPEWKDANDRIEQLWKQHPAGSSQLTLMAREDSRTSHILKRGDFLKPGKPIEPGVPTVLHPLPADADGSRLALAKWLVDRQSPTTARAIVNRVWQHYFGIGFVSSSEDLGVQCEPPTHPELFDWLAATFMDDLQWSLKSLHRLIVTSATYRQSSRTTPELLAKDPQNRLYARASRMRVEGEIIRDVAMAASGLLNPKLGGPSVYPPAPEFLFVPPASYGPKVWQEDHDADRYRRALYTFRFRSVPYPALAAFDTPNADASCVRRTRSNTPLQALTLLNETLFMECARSLALKTLEQGGESNEERLRYAFRRCVARQPTDSERSLLLGLIDQETKRFVSESAKPWELAAADPANPPKLKDGVTPAEAAAWTIVARIVLNMDETITRE